MGWKHRDLGRSDFDDGQPNDDVAFEGPAALSCGHWSGSTYVYDPEIQSSSYPARGDNQWSAGSLSSSSFISEVQENNMSDIGTIFAIILSSYVFGAATGPYAWGWLKSRGQKW